MRPQATILALASLACVTHLPTLGWASLAGTTPLVTEDEDQACAELPTYVLRAEKLVVRPGKVLENVSVLVRGGEIVLISPEIPLPEGATEIKGKVVCASFMDPWSALGVDSNVLNDKSLNEEARVSDALNLYSGDFLRQQALEAGVTTARLQGGYRGSTGGLGAVVRLDPELDDPSTAVLLSDANLGMSVGLTVDSGARLVRGADGSLQFLSGDEPVDVFDRVSAIDKLISKLESGAAYRQAELEYAHKLDEWNKEIAEQTKKLEGDYKKAKKSRDKDVKEAEEKGKEFKEKKYKESRKPKQPKQDDGKAALASVAEGEIPLVVEVHRSSEIRNLLERTKSFGRLRLVIAGGSEALSSAKELAEREIPVIVWPALRGNSAQDEFASDDLSLAGVLAARGVPILLGTGGRGEDATRDLPLLAQMAIGHGLDPEVALRALTVDAARTFDMAGSIGTVELGKDADLLVLDGMPLMPGTNIEHVFCGGRLAVSNKN